MRQTERTTARIATMRVTRRGRVALTSLLTVVTLLACGAPERRQRVLLIGIDGASPKVAFPMMQAGQLPSLAAIAKEGVHGELRSVLPLYSPRIWNTIATGRPPAQHGVVAFVKKSDSEDKQLYLSNDRKVPALWNILSDQGRSVGMVNWWTTYPPEKIDGVMVSDHFFPEQIAMIKRTFKDDRASRGALVHPESWQPQAEALRESDEPALAIGDPFAGNDALPHWVNAGILSGQYATDAAITRVALGLQAEHDPDVMIVFLPGIDRVSHWLWGNLEDDEKYPETLRPNDTERAAGAAALYRYYAYTDELIGLLTRDYTADDLVMVISDHGFEADVSLMLLTGGHDSPNALDGVIFARGHGIARGLDPGRMSVFDIAPTVLAWLGIPVARDMPGRPAGFLGIEPAPRIASYDGLQIERISEAASGHETEIVEHLRALGYLEEASAEPTPPDGAAAPHSDPAMP